MTVGCGWMSIVFKEPATQCTNGCFPYIVYLNAIQYIQFLIISHNMSLTCHNLLYFMQVV